MAREAAARCEARAAHRTAQEAAISEAAREAALTAGGLVTQEALSFAGEVQQELQFVDAASPLGRESYGLMMLVNALAPLLEHGMRPDWRAVTPAVPVAAATAWARSMPYANRYAAPCAFALLLVRRLLRAALRRPDHPSPELRRRPTQAAEHGWRDAAPAAINAASIEALTDAASPERRTQAWLFQGLSAGSLAQQLAALLASDALLEDWFFPWAALRQADTTALLVEELVLVSV